MKIFSNETKFIACLVMAMLNMLFTVIAFRAGQDYGMQVLSMFMCVVGACVFWVLDGWEEGKKK